MKRWSAGLCLAFLAAAIAVLAPGTSAHAAPGLQSNVSPVMASWGNRTVAVVTGTDGRIFYDWWDLGGGGHGWREVPGGGLSDAAPAAALVAGGGYLFITVKGLDGNLYLNQGTLGGGFVGWQSMGFASNVAAGMASSGNRSVVVAKSGDGRVFYDWWDLGGGGHGWRELPGGPVTYDTPAAALMADGYHVFFTIRDFMRGSKSVQLNQGTLGGGFTGWWSMQQQFNAGPEMSSSGNRAFIGIETYGGLVEYDWWDLGGADHGWWQVPGAVQYTSGPPGVALVANGGYVFILVRGLDSNLYLNQGTPGGSFVGWLPVS